MTARGSPFRLGPCLMQEFISTNSYRADLLPKAINLDSKLLPPPQLFLRWRNVFGDQNPWKCLSVSSSTVCCMAGLFNNTCQYTASSFVDNASE